jgi:hypothetical protein
MSTVSVWVIYGTYGLALFVQTIFLFKGIELLKQELQKPIDPNAPKPITRVQNMLTEKDGNNNEKTSFSRTAGSLGGVVLAAILVGSSYWLQYSLFFGEPSETNIKAIGTLLLYGSALFAPYGFNRLASLFK